MSKSKLILGAGIAALALAAASPAGATVGYFSNGFDTESKSMSGIGVSMGDGPVAAANNPALGVKLGNQAGACLSLFSPHRDLNITGGPSGGGQYVLNNGKYDSGKDLFEIPCAGVNVSVNDSTAVGLMLYANGGMNTHFSANPMGAGFGQASSPYGSDIEQVFVSANGAHAAGNGFTLGLAPIFAVQRMNMQGFQAFNSGSSAPGFVTNNGYDYSYGGGAKLGVLYDPVSWLTLGTSYQTHIWMTAFDMYKGLFAEAGKFDVPPTWTQGLTVRPTTGLDVSFEHETIYYGDIPRSPIRA